MKTLIVGLLTSLSLQMASAQNLEEVRPYWKTGWYSTGATLSHTFDRPTYVERLMISAEGYRNFAKAFVYADGEYVALLGVPGVDPDYPVVIRKTVSSIVVKFEGDVRIRDFRLYVSESGGYDTYHTANLGNLNTPADLGKAVIRVIADLQTVVSDSEFRQYLLPLRQSALILAAKGQGRPLLSDNTQRQARIIVSQLKRAEIFLLGRLAHSDYYSDKIQTLLFVKEKLESMYEIY